MDRIYSLLALLLVGSASLQAQGGDPFGEFNSRLYQNNMTVTAQVVLNGTVVTEAIVAAYCGNELRGKNFVGNDPTHPSLIYLQVYANSTGTLDQFLHFKVFTNGHVFTFNPDPVMVFKNNDQHGKTSSPYIIDITPVSLPNDSDNASRLTRLVDKTCDIVLTGRVLNKDGAWNTLCLPFSLSEEQIAASDLAGATIMELDATGTYDTDKHTGFDAASDTLYLYFKTTTSIEAGKPYIVKWTSGNNLENPVFTGVTVTSTEAVTVEAKNSGLNTVQFIGTYSPAPLIPNDKDNLFIGDENTLYYPNAANNADGQYYVKSCRAYFHVDLEGSAGIRAFVLNFGAEETQGVTTPLSPARGAGGEAWFTLDGRRLNGKPTQSGVYVNNGRKLNVVVK